MSQALGLKVSIPGKVFLIGEYLAMLGKPCLVAAVQPCFQFYFSQSQNAGNPFHPDSPAGRLWSDKIQQSWNLQWDDPHRGAGGWGGSTAEYLAVQSLVDFEVQQKPQNSWQVREEYLRISGRGARPTRPSGADLLAQDAGGLSVIESSAQHIENIQWPFAQMGFLLVKTPVKVKTHEHLQQIQNSGGGLNFSTESLESSCRTALSGLKMGDPKAWLRGVQSFAEQLKELGLVAKSTQELLASLSPDLCLAAKGCGALGADVIVSFYSKEDPDSKTALQAYFVAQHCQVVADEKSLSKGRQTQILAAGDNI